MWEEKGKIVFNLSDKNVGPFCKFQINFHSLSKNTDLSFDTFKIKHF